MNETVLIVEDDSDIIEILSLYLCGSDYQVETAANGKLGLELLERKSPSVILVDLMMPEMNGFDFIKEARSVSNAPIIIISARSQPPTRCSAWIWVPTGTSRSRSTRSKCWPTFVRFSDAAMHCPQAAQATFHQTVRSCAWVP